MAFLCESVINGQPGWLMHFTEIFKNWQFLNLTRESYSLALAHPFAPTVKGRSARHLVLCYACTFRAPPSPPGMITSRPLSASGKQFLAAYWPTSHLFPPLSGFLTPGDLKQRPCGNEPPWELSLLKSRGWSNGKKPAHFLNIQSLVQ